MTSIKDVARLAGMGSSTVSRVLHEKGYVSEKARQKVMQAVDELNYVPNSLARSMRGGLTNTIGFLVYDILNPFFANLAAGVEEEAFKQGFNVIMCSTLPWKDPNREEGYMNMLLQKQIDGLITQHKFSTNKFYEMINSRGKQITRLVSPQEGFSCDLVRCDTEQAAFDLVTHLISQGKRRIAALGPALPSSLGDERIAGYRRALLSSGLEYDDALVQTVGWRTRDGYTMCQNVYQRAKPDAFFAFGPRIAVGAVCAFRERGLRIPEEVAVVCVDDFGMGSDLDPFMTVARQPEQEIGRIGVRLLLDRILCRYDGPPREVILPAEIIIRRSSVSQDLLKTDIEDSNYRWEDDDYE